MSAGIKFRQTRLSIELADFPPFHSVTLISVAKSVWSEPLKMPTAAHCTLSDIRAHFFVWALFKTPAKRDIRFTALHLWLLQRIISSKCWPNVHLRTNTHTCRRQAGIHLKGSVCYSPRSSICLVQCCCCWLTTSACVRCEANLLHLSGKVTDKPPTCTPIGTYANNRFMAARQSVDTRPCFQDPPLTAAPTQLRI